MGGRVRAERAANRPMTLRVDRQIAHPNLVQTGRPPTRARVRTGNRVLWSGLLSLAIINTAVGITGHGFLNGNESLYVESAREMLRSGSWVVPALNGLPYLEKPPLMDWLLLFAFRFGGISEATARAIPMGASILAALALARFARLLRIGGPPAAAAYIYLTSLGVVLMSSVAMPDALLISLFGIGCAAFAAALETQSRNLARLSFLALGLACLTKGFLPAVLFALILAAYVAARPVRLTPVLHLSRDPVAWLLLLAPVVAWVVAAEVSLPGAAWRFVVDEHILRFLGTREPRDYYAGSVFYYVPRLFLFAFPWVGVLAFGWAVQRRKQRDQRQDVRHFLWASVWVPFIFFSVSQAKANYYVTLCLPAMALLTADYAQALTRTRCLRWRLLAVLVPALTVLILYGIGIWLVATGRQHPLPAHLDGSLAITSVAAWVSCLALAGLAAFGWRRTTVFGLGLLLVPLTVQLHHLASLADKDISARQMAAYIRSSFPDTPVFLYQDYEAYGALPVYLDRTIPVIDSRSNDLYFGARVRPADPSLTSPPAVLRLERALIVVLAEREETFRRSELWPRSEPVCRYGRATLYQLAPAERVAKM